MPISTLTAKGQTTIPAVVREYLNLHTGDRLEFIIQHDGKVHLVPATLDITGLKGILPRPPAPVSVEAMNAAIRDRSGKP
jgi:antitoxin PrlF